LLGDRQLSLRRDDPEYVLKKMKNLCETEGFNNLDADHSVDHSVVDQTVQFAFARLYGYHIQTDNEVMPCIRLTPGNVSAPAKY